MIYDKLSNAKRYLGLSSNLDAALCFIAEHDLNELPLGKTTILGDQVFINVMTANAAPLEEKQFEIHKKYMDIQIDLFGTERIDIGDSNNINVLEFNNDGDIGFVESDTLTECTMGPGNFIICMAEEPHKPGIATGADISLKKCVVKVHI